MSHFSPHDCDLLAAELLPAKQAAELRAHAGTCERCAGSLREAEAGRAAFLVAHPPAARAPALLEEARPRRSPWRWYLPIGSAVAAAASLLLFLHPGPSTRLKGGSLSCRLVRQGRELALVGPRQRPDAMAGDALRCTAAPEDDLHHLEVWGVDAVGAQRLYTGELAGPGEVPPDSAFAVGGQGEMRLYFVWSKQPLSEVAPALARLPEQPSLAGARIEWLGVVAR